MEATPGTATNPPDATDLKLRGLVEYTHWMYGLHSLSVITALFTAHAVALRFAFGLPSIIAVVMNYARRSETHGTWLESHFLWQIRTFWYAWLWILVSLIIAIPLILLAGLGFLVGLPIAVALGSPVSAGLLSLHGLFGYKGWQIMYLAEGVPTILLGILCYFVMTDKPEQAKFLTQAEKDWLAGKLASERKAKERVRVYTLLESLWNPKVLLLSLNYLGIVTASLGMLFFIPQIIKSLGTNVSDNMAIMLTMIPYVCGGIALLVWGRVSDRMNERRWNLLLACLLSTGGLVMAGLTMGTWWALVGMSLAAMGFYGSKGPFFAMPPMFLSGTALAAGIAWINSLGNIGGFFGPWWIGIMKDATGNFSGGLYGLAILSFISALVCWLFLRIPDPITAENASPRLAPAQ